VPTAITAPIRSGIGAPDREIPRRFRPWGVPQFGHVQDRVFGRAWYRSPQTVHPTKFQLAAHATQRYP
jgi:hypothetical protein